jgi:hypothetical protein
MDGNGRVQIFEVGGEFDGFLVFAHVGADGNPPGYASRLAALNHAVDVAGKVVKRQMAMGINQLHL